MPRRWTLHGCWARRTRPALWRVLLLLATTLSVSGCSRKTLSAFFDLPQRAAAPPSPVVRPDAAVPGAATTHGQSEPRPAFEGTLDPDSAVKLLPRDHAGNIDWVQAARSGVIRPRPVLPGRALPDTGGFKFGFDFNLAGPDTLFDAYFPHSTHTQWLNCNTCHARIFPYKDTKFKMADVFMGKFCGECHGKVSFPVTTACERCHVRMTMTANRAKPELLGTIKITRAAPDSTGGVIAGNAAGVTTSTLPLASFPHWVHRSRYLCKSCHMELFVPRAGANRITMRLISEGKACGACHDGKTAFAAGFGSCDRCHVPPRPPPPPPPPATAIPPTPSSHGAAASPVR